MEKVVFKDNVQVVKQQVVKDVPVEKVVEVLKPGKKKPGSKDWSADIAKAKNEVAQLEKLIIAANNAKTIAQNAAKRAQASPALSAATPSPPVSSQMGASKMSPLAGPVDFQVQREGRGGGGRERQGGRDSSIHPFPPPATLVLLSPVLPCLFRSCTK